MWVDREKMIIHILKNGTVLDDITGHVVKIEDAPTAYALLNERRQENGNNLRGHQKGEQRVYAD